MAKAITLPESRVTELIGAVKDYYSYIDDPPVDEVIIHPWEVKRTLKNNNFYLARVTTVCNYIPNNPKAHTTTMYFALDKYDKINPRTVSYI